ncbi:MAG: endo-1,4-beta-xylanase [Opitutales bacterium]
MIALSTQVPAADDWRSYAQARIQEHRTGTLNVVVRNRKGDPLPGLQVSAKLLRHDFLFGTQTAPKNFPVDSEDARWHREELPRLFNTLVFANGQKMNQSQRIPFRAQTEAVVDWAHTHDFAWRGHTLVWGVLKYSPVIVQPFHEQIKEGQPIDREALLHRIDQSILDRCLRYRGKIRHWDVVNEPVSERHLFHALGAESVEDQAALMARWFKLAHQADPSARLYMNDFGILVTQNEAKRERYYQLAKALVELGAPLHGVGFQAHTWNQDHVNPPEKLNKIFDRFADLGLELCITEFDTFGKWPAASEGGERLRTEWFEQLLITAYSHPAMTGFMVWGIQDFYHWKESAPFYDAQWQPKPSLKVYEDLVLNQWRTQADGTTDANGQFTFNGHHGLYQFEISDGQGQAFTISAAHHPDLQELALTWSPN